jgi:EmrB/QacA subfamily drug resistance transporter
VVGFGVFVAADDLTVVTTMLRPIIGDLGIVLPDGLDDAAWIVNAYLIAYVAVMPFAGRLSDIVGRRKVFIGAMTLFMLGSFLIPLTSSLGPFLAARVLTAIGGGALVPVSLAVIGDAYAEAKRARAMGILGAIDTLGWVWGPLYGALIIRFLDWRWQFWFNIPLAIIGIALAWWALSAHDSPVHSSRIDWWGTVTLTTALVALNLALLGSADVQSVSGLDELTGGSNSGAMRWLYLVALVATIAFVMIQRRVEDPLLDLSLFRGRNLTSAVIVNFLTGATLVIAMVNVPLFVNIVELEIERSAVIAGLVLSALTATMALTSYLGGRFSERTWYQPPVLAGLAAAAAGFLLMGLTWSVDTAYGTMMWQLALLGAGFGFIIAPTSAAVVDAAEPDRRGTAASLVIVFRLIGLSVGLSALTAWGLYRFNELRRTIELPPLDDPGYADAAIRAQTELTTSALADTFVAAALVIVAAIGVALFMRRPKPPANEAATGAMPEASAVPPQEDRE